MGFLDKFKKQTEQSKIKVPEDEQEELPEKEESTKDQIQIKNELIREWEKLLRDFKEEKDVDYGELKIQEIQEEGIQLIETELQENKDNGLIVIHLKMILANKKREYETAKNALEMKLEYLEKVDSLSEKEKQQKREEIQREFDIKIGKTEKPSLQKQLEEALQELEELEYGPITLEEIREKGKEMIEKDPNSDTLPFELQVLINRKKEQIQQDYKLLGRKLDILSNQKTSEINMIFQGLYGDELIKYKEQFAKKIEVLKFRQKHGYDVKKELTEMYAKYLMTHGYGEEAVHYFEEELQDKDIDEQERIVNAAIKENEEYALTLMTYKKQTKEFIEMIFGNKGENHEDEFIRYFLSLAGEKRKKYIEMLDKKVYNKLKESVQDQQAKIPMEEIYKELGLADEKIGWMKSIDESSQRVSDIIDETLYSKPFSSWLERVKNLRELKSLNEMQDGNNSTKK